MRRTVWVFLRPLFIELCMRYGENELFINPIKRLRERRTWPNIYLVTEHKDNGVRSSGR